MTSTHATALLLTTLLVACASPPTPPPTTIVIQEATDPTPTQAVAQEPAQEQPRFGVLVEPGTYEVHRRVIWDLGWAPASFDHTYNEHPKTLPYRPGRSLVLKPLQGYGVPDPQRGAERRVRLYVNYGHQWMCNGTPTVRIGGVEFNLPTIHGHYADAGASYSDFRTWSEIKDVRHAKLQVYLKNFEYGGDHCGPYPGTDRPKGVMLRIEAVHYDVFPEETSQQQQHQQQQQ